MITVLITGGQGQLANSIRSISIGYPNINFIFKSSLELDITKKKDIESVFRDIKDIDYCVNCAAYTAVDKAEFEVAMANSINNLGPQNLALECKLRDVILIHISTDFVFDGLSNEPYKEDVATNPLSLYGKTKLKGENAILGILKNHFIIRTSWLYSEFGNNFFKTMLKLANEREEISVVDDQLGCPTYAKDLAEVILKFIETKSTSFGIYHFSNKGSCSWYDFAKEIFNQTNISIKLNRIKTEDYPTVAIRPKYSILETAKIIKTLNLEIPDWKEGLKIALSNLMLK